MKHPHPWLARSAKACLVVSALYLLLAVGDILLLKHLLSTTGGGWGGWFEWDLIVTAPTTGRQVRIARERTAARLTHLMLPAAGVFAAVCLRRVATGRLRLTATAPIGRLWPLVGLWTAVACGGLELTN